MRAAIITISSSLSQGRGEDESGPALAEFARGLGAEIAATEIVTDNRAEDRVGAAALRRQRRLRPHPDDRRNRLLP